MDWLDHPLLPGPGLDHYNMDQIEEDIVLKKYFFSIFFKKKLKNTKKVLF